MKQKTFKITPVTLVQYRPAANRKNWPSTDPTTTTVTSTSVTCFDFAKPAKR